VVRIEPWSERDLPLLQKCLGDAAMMSHLGGAESPEKIANRQAEYVQPGSRQFKIVDESSGDGAGWVGFWDREWQGEAVYEIGWMVVPEFQGRGIAVAATAQAVERAKRDDKHRFMHAFPSVGNAPSNAISANSASNCSKRASSNSPRGTS
jgi:RimJ/RimL family protein N-acetyltransferase